MDEERGTESYREYLKRKGEEFGFGEPKKSEWIQYMEKDIDRGEELLRDLLDRFDLPLESRRRALDMGCGFGGQLKALQEYFEECAGIDIVEERVAWTKRRAPGAEVACGSAVELPWPEDHFDLAIASDLFEHVSFDEQHAAAAEMLRVLRPGGRGFVSVPNRFQLKDEHNNLWFGTYLPEGLRRTYAALFSSNKQYVPCTERTGRGWRRLFHVPGFEVEIRPFESRRIFLLPPFRYRIYLKKPLHL